MGTLPRDEKDYSDYLKHLSGASRIPLMEVIKEFVLAIV